ncbi:tetratricopeptide repeat protein [Bradyrhizobium sp. NP1]|uniref:tetratricopeptide repeat protein n=1 Tax=Bradyrhizobium sp. NP1 TaxID=3049772 RepID=UPI0025A53AD4|nr:tetratricopeptide repeat protein [Bradyrhizobium sp. NP1]WJR76950.1 tetratricopeptide repeat protein [Bradyrhizobium sp. NP1]
MIKSATQVVTLTFFFLASLTGTPANRAFAAGGGGGGGGGPPGEDIMRPSSSSNTKPAPAERSSHRTKKSSKQSFLSDPAFVAGYRAAYPTIYDRNDYEGAIRQLHALGHDDYANVANLIGYSYRKLGDYRLSQVWYERALKSDPNHVLTWQYYGLWQIEQGNRDQAEYHLRRIASICGTDCDEYRSLAAALAQPPGSGLVY